MTGRGVVAERPALEDRDAATAQLAAFLGACRDRRPAPVGIGVGLSLLDVAEAVRRRIELVAHRPAGLRAA